LLRMFNFCMHGSYRGLAYQDFSDCVRGRSQSHACRSAVDSRAVLTMDFFALWQEATEAMHVGSVGGVTRLSVATRSLTDCIFDCLWLWLTVLRCYFLPARRYASAGNSDRNVSVCPSVCLSVCLSRAGIVSKRRKLSAWFFHHLVAPRL